MVYYRASTVCDTELGKQIETFRFWVNSGWLGAVSCLTRMVGTHIAHVRAYSESSLQGRSIEYLATTFGPSDLGKLIETFRCGYSSGFFFSKNVSIK
jgi:hypothetical protein